MKFSYLILMIFALLSFDSIGKDKYKVGDEMYIWAKNGLNLRDGPGTNFNIVSKLGFGEDVIVLGKTNKSFNVNVITEVESTLNNSKIGPVVLKGNWTFVRASNGLSGYLIDQYLLLVEPFDRSKPIENGINLSLIGVDTIYKSPIIHDGSGLNSTIEHTYSSNVRMIESSGGYWSESQFIFLNYNIEEALILLSSSWKDYKNFKLIRNWKNEIVFTDNVICQFKVIEEGKKIVITIGCSC